METPDHTSNALTAYMAMSMANDVRRISAITSRNGKLLRHLEKFYFPRAAPLLAGLLTRIDNHCATARIEAIIHMLALVGRGTAVPTHNDIRRWLNNDIRKDPISQIEDPPEDIFVSNLVTWFGNVRLLEGSWNDNGYYVQTCLSALSVLQEKTWAVSARRHVTAVLRLSEAVAERANVSRNIRSDSLPRRPIKITRPVLAQSASYVAFTYSELIDMHISPSDLDPFVFQQTHVPPLISETLGHTSLERRPLLHYRRRIIVVLPTAIGAAVRRYILECASEAGELETLNTAITQLQIESIKSIGLPFWGIRRLQMPSVAFHGRSVDFVGTFDDGGYVHLMYVADNLAETATHGLQGVNFLEGLIDPRVDAHANSLSAKADYRHGLTCLVHGGIGRGFSAGFGEPPAGWQRLGLAIPDFLLLANDSDCNALRAWKLLQQEESIQSKGFFLKNINGFPNYYEFRSRMKFGLVPETLHSGIIDIGTEFVALLRYRLRNSVDFHAAVAPGGGSWLEVQRKNLAPLFSDAENAPVYISRHHAQSGSLLACTETTQCAWWTCCEDLPPVGRQRDIAIMIWEMTLNWLEHLAPRLQQLVDVPASKPPTYYLSFPEIDKFTDTYALGGGDHGEPAVVVLGDRIVVECSPEYLRSFVNADNIGERLMISALVRGAYMYASSQEPAKELLDKITRSVLQSGRARFVHITPARSPEEVLYNSVVLPEPRFVAPEDREWSRLGLARKVGWAEEPGPIPGSHATKVLNEAVEYIWTRIRERLQILDRASVVERSLLNFEAIRRDRMTWRISSAALLALCRSEEEVMETSNRREWDRGVAGLASRVIAEMAVCTSPLAGGSACSWIDLDYLIADVGTLLECAAYSDAIYYDLATEQPTALANGSLGFDVSIGEMVGSYLGEYGERAVRSAANEYEQSFVLPTKSGDLDANFDLVFEAEFGLSVKKFAEFVGYNGAKAYQQSVAHFWTTRRELIDGLRDIGVVDAERSVASFALTPREKWDERWPKNAKQRDWYPWRYNRRLSITRKPLVQIDYGNDSMVLVVPTLLDRTFHYLIQSYHGRLPGSLFDSIEMIAWIGGAIDRGGHEFNRTVANELRKLGWKVKSEVNLTSLGGGVELGDIDVIAWLSTRKLVYFIECKKLMLDRTVGEIGERLREYTGGTVVGERTPIQKHLDRMRYLEKNRTRVGNFLEGMNQDLLLRSALVTDGLVPMQFLGPVRDMIDVVTDYGSLSRTFPVQ